MTRNTIDGRVYIGSSIHIKHRIRGNICHLKQGVFHNKPLQKAWNEHGSKFFEFVVLEICDRNILAVKEQFWMDYYRYTNPEQVYNIAKIIINDHREKSSVLAKRRIKMLGLTTGVVHF